MNVLVKHPRSGLPPTVQYNLSYLQLQLQLQLVVKTRTTQVCVRKGVTFTLGASHRYSEDRLTARSVYVKRVTLTLGASQSVAKTRRFTQRSQFDRPGGDQEIADSRDRVIINKT